MAEYSTQFKLDVAQQCLQAEAGVQSIAGQHGLIPGQDAATLQLMPSFRLGYSSCPSH